MAARALTFSDISHVLTDEEVTQRVICIAFMSQDVIKILLEIS